MYFENCIVSYVTKLLGDADRKSAYSHLVLFAHLFEEDLDEDEIVRLRNRRIHHGRPDRGSRMKDQTLSMAVDLCWQNRRQGAFVSCFDLPLRDQLSVAVNVLQARYLRTTSRAKMMLMLTG